MSVPHVGNVRCSCIFPQGRSPGHIAGNCLLFRSLILETELFSEHSENKGRYHEMKTPIPNTPHIPFNQTRRQDQSAIVQANTFINSDNVPLSDFDSTMKRAETTVEEPSGARSIAYSTTKSNLSEYDSGYGSESRPTMTEKAYELPVQRNESKLSTAEGYGRAKLDYDIRSLASENDDINSQASTEISKAVLSGQALMSMFLAEDPKFRALCEKVLAQIDKQRFLENIQRLLRSLYNNLSTEARSEGEKAVAKLLRERQGRLRICQRLIVRIELEQDLAKENKEHDLGIAPEDKLSLEKWLADVSNSPANLPEQRLDHQDSDDECTEHEAQDDFPFTSGLKQFLGESESFKSLIRDFMLWLLPVELQEVLLSIPRDRIWESQDQDLTLANLAKAWVEDKTGVSWNWWPLEARKRALRGHEIRLFWLCVC